MADNGRVLDTIIAEALGEGPQGMAAVAHVINTRAQQLGISPEDVVSQAGQFSGYSNPGSSVARSMQDPSVRAQVQQIWDGVTSGQIPNPFPGADYFKTPDANPNWASVYGEQGQLGNHQFYASGATPVRREAPTPMAPIMRPANSATAAIDTAAPSAGSRGDWLSYANQGATRSQPLSDQLTSALSFLPDLGVTMKVFSGGQPAPGEGPRVGSTRHDHGNAADVYFYKDGRQLDWANPDDLPVFQQIVRQGKERGITGFGAGEGYMRPGSMHLGFGTPGVWGADGKGVNAPSWLRNAYDGVQAPATTAPRPVSALPAATPNPAGGGWLGSLMASAKGGINSAIGAIGQQAAPIMRSAQGIAPAAVMQALSTVEGRSAIGSYLAQKNVARAPVMVAGYQPGGTQVQAINNQGMNPATLMRANDGSVGSASSQAFDAQAHPGQNMDVYRTNAAAVGGGGRLNASGIREALDRGATLVRSR